MPKQINAAFDSLPSLTQAMHETTDLAVCEAITAFLGEDQVTFAYLKDGTRTILHSSGNMWRMQFGSFHATMHPMAVRKVVTQGWTYELFEDADDLYGELADRCEPSDDRFSD